MKKFIFNQHIYQFHRLNWHDVLINQKFSHIILIILYLVCVIILFGTRMNLLHLSGQIANLDDHAIYATPNNFQDLCDSFEPDYKHSVQTITIDPNKNGHPYFYNLTYTQGLFIKQVKMRPLNIIENHLHTTGLTTSKKPLESYDDGWSKKPITLLNHHLSKLQYQLDYDSLQYTTGTIIDPANYEPPVLEPTWHDDARQLYQNYIKSENHGQALSYNDLLKSKVTLPAYNNAKIWTVDDKPYAYDTVDMDDTTNDHVCIPQLTTLNNGKWKATIQFYNNYLATRQQSPIKASDVVYYKDHYYFQTAINGLYVKDSNVTKINGKLINDKTLDKTLFRSHSNHVFNPVKDKLSVHYRKPSFDLQPFDIYEASKNAILNVYNNRHEPEITYIP